MGDVSFVKYYVCTYTGQNPYSDESKLMPDIYWMLQLLYLRTKDKHEWKYFYEPQGELIGSIAEPQVYQAYLKHKKRANKSETLEEAMATPDGEYADGFMSASTTTRLDPVKGLVDEDGNVLIPKYEFEKENNMGGIAISY